MTDKLNMRKLCAKLVPQLLMDDWKNHQVTELLKRMEIELDFLDNIITGDET